MKPHQLFLTAALIATGMVTSVAISSSHEPVSDDVTFDGLVEVKKSVFARAWIDPTVDFSRYTKVMAGDARFEFRAVRETTRSSARSSSKSEFYIPEESRQKLIEIVSEVFVEEVGKSKYFAIVDEPGRDVVILDGAMLDIVSRVPPQQAGRHEIYISRVGEITLVLQLRDSMSDEVIARAAERRAIEPAGGRGMRSNPVTTWTEVRRLARRWGSKLRRGLDEFHTK